MTDPQRTGDGPPVVDRSTRDYLAELTAHLYRRHVPGTRIGEILAEVEAHVAATGEPAAGAFGPAREYARRWATPLTPPQRRRRAATVFAVLLAAAASGAVIAAAALNTGRGTPLFGLPAAPVLALAVLVLVAAIAVVPLDQVIDPRTGRSRSTGRGALLLGAGVVLALVVGALVAAGAWLG